MVCLARHFTDIIIFKKYLKNTSDTHALYDIFWKMEKFFWNKKYCKMC